MRYQQDDDETAPPPADRDDAPGTEGHLYVGDAYHGDPNRADAEQVTADDTGSDRPAAVDPVDDAAVPTERLDPPSAADSAAGPAEVQRVHGDLVYTEPADSERVSAEPAAGESAESTPADESAESTPVDPDPDPDPEAEAEAERESGAESGSEVERTEIEPAAVEPADTADTADTRPADTVDAEPADTGTTDERPADEPLVLDDVADVPRSDDDAPTEEAMDVPAEDRAAEDRAADDVAADDLAAAEPAERDPRADDDPEALGPVAVVAAADDGTFESPRDGAVTGSTVDEPPAALSDVDEVEAVPAVVPVPEATAEPARTSENGELLPGAVESAPLAGFWPEGVADGLRERWRDVQLRFLDEPRAAAEEAKSLVGEAVTALSNGLSARADELHGWLEGNGDTEELRVAVRRYRDLLDRLFSL